jgi:vacuolar-type H+-ATPase subunit F/Vma7
MSSHVRVLASPAIAAGFRLAGLPADTLDAGDDPAARLLAAVALPDLGILIVEQLLLDAVPDDVRRDVERRALPILVPMPAPAWGEARGDAEAYILELLRRAIGYRVRLQ